MRFASLPFTRVQGQVSKFSSRWAPTPRISPKTNWL